MTRKSTVYLWIGLAIAAVLETIVQFLWKSAARDIATSTGILQTFIDLVENPIFQITIVLWIAQLINWLLVLSKSDLSFAQPMSAISYITVTAVAYYKFHEHISPLRGAGILLIVIGAWQMGATNPHTRTEAKR